MKRRGYLTDARIKPRDNGPALRKRIAAFSGTGFSAEREGDELVIYLVSNDSISTGTIGDRKSTGMTAARLQEKIAKHRTLRND